MRVSLVIGDFKTLVKGSWSGKFNASKPAHCLHLALLASNKKLNATNWQ